MKFCPSCGSQLSDEVQFCPNCGTAFPQNGGAAPDPSAQSQWSGSSYGSPPPYQTPYQAPYQNAYQNPYQTPYQQPYRPTTSTGGLIAWGIISLFLCMIPGIVGLVYATKISRATSAQEEAHFLSVSKTWLIVATVLGILAFISALLTRNSFYYYY